MHRALDRALGLPALQAHLAALGIEAAPLEPSAFDRRFLSQDRHLLALGNSPLDVLSVRVGGHTTILDPGGPSFSVRVGIAPLLSRQLLPVQHHWLVRHVPADAAAVRAAVKVKRRGLFDASKAGLSFDGPLGRVLAADPIAAGVLEEHLAAGESLRVEVDPGLGLVRLVHQKKEVVSYGLLEPGFAGVQRTLPPEPLVRALEGIARLVRRF